MKSLYRIRSIFVVAVNRLLAQRLLTLTTIAGLTVAIALILTIPIYSESVSFEILKNQLSNRGGQANRSPFAYFFSYLGAWGEPVNLEDTIALDEYLRAEGSQNLGLDVEFIVQHLETQNFRLYPGDETNYDDEDRSIEYVTFGTTDDIENYVTLLEGSFPAPAEATPDSVIDVMIREEFATLAGIQPGEIYAGYNWRLETGDSQKNIPIRIAGIWQENDNTDPFWLYEPKVFNDILIVHPDTFTNRISPYRDTEIHLAVWFIQADGSSVNTARVDELIERHDAVEKQADLLLPDTFIQVSPIKELRPYQRTTRILTLTLTVFSVPIVALMVIFLSMVIGLLVDRQRNETAVLRSRGTSPLQIVGLAIVEGSIMGFIALGLGIGLATIFTRLMGSVRSFMDFGYSDNFLISFSPAVTVAAGAAFLGTIVLRLLPTISAARNTIVSYKMESSRRMQRPVWQRTGLDLLLIIFVGYLYYQVAQQGSLIDVESISEIEQAYDQPVLFLLPPLTILALTLLALRFLPLILRAITGIIQLTDNVGLLIVTRQLERSTSTYYLPLILLICTTALGIYTASFARTIDRYLYEQEYYRLGADLSVRVFSLVQTSIGEFNDSSDNPAFMSVSEYRTMDQVEGATRIGEYDAEARLTSGNGDGKFIGVDRSEIGDVMFWREDFASIRLGYLMNALATQPDTVLVSRGFMEERALEIGDFIQIDLSVSGTTFPLDLQIAGIVDYFPQWYPESDGALFVGNLDYTFEQAGTELAHRTILRVGDNFDEREFINSVRQRGRGAISVLIDEPFSRIEREQSRPQRQGLFGLLSIGFVASALATTFGFLLYTVFSYQRRYVELGILRAIGLSQTSMILSVAWELALLTLTGLVLGLGLGLLTSILYIPYMQFVTNLSGITPPYLVTFAHSEIAIIVGLFTVIFIALLLILLVILQRLRIFQAVKLGESL